MLLTVLVSGLSASSGFANAEGTYAVNAAQTASGQAAVIGKKEEVVYANLK